jgi:aspartyl-tRNA synthetase
VTVEQEWDRLRELEQGEQTDPLGEILSDLQTQIAALKAAKKRIPPALVKIAREAGYSEHIARSMKLKKYMCSYDKDEETGEIDFEHNPFSMPQGGMEALMGDPLSVRGYQYDLACNGYELVSGAIRNHKPEIMLKAFEIAGYGEDEVKNRFGALYNAFHFGAPPHGGCAAGIDRIVMLLAGTSNIREVIMFPMNQRAEDLMMHAPSDPTSDQLMELGLRVLPKD